jgi:hypothetical protein
MLVKPFSGSPRPPGAGLSPPRNQSPRRNPTRLRHNGCSDFRCPERATYHSPGQRPGLERKNTKPLWGRLKFRCHCLIIPIARAYVPSRGCGASRILKKSVNQSEGERKACFPTSRTPSRSRILPVPNGQDGIANGDPAGRGSRQRTASRTSNYLLPRRCKRSCVFADPKPVPLLERSQP